MADSKIRWTRSDIATLSRAVRDFNKKVNKLQAEENKLYLPEEISYQKTKENITTRRELNRVINSLKRFKREGAEDLYVTEVGAAMTKWERRELGIQSRIAVRRLQREYETLNVPKPGEKYSRVQMGSERATEIKRQIKRLQDIEGRTGESLSLLKKSIRFQGASDYEMKKATIFRENYITEMQKYKGFKNYNKFMNKLKSIQNPIEFYNFVSKNELMQDLTYQSDELYGEENFNKFISQFDIEGLEDNEETISDLEEKYTWTKGMQKDVDRLLKNSKE